MEVKCQEQFFLITSPRPAPTDSPNYPNTFLLFLLFILYGENHHAHTIHP